MKPIPKNLYSYLFVVVLLFAIIAIVVSTMVPEPFLAPPHPTAISTIPPSWMEYDPQIALMISQIDESEIYNTTYDLQNFTSRVDPSYGNREAALYLYQRMNNISGLETEYQGKNNQNIIATLPGRNNSSDMIFIVGAHYDSCSTNPDQAPGATDNGCGVAIVLELARVMSRYQFNNTIKFALWNSEENGGAGSRDYATEAAGNSLNIPLYFNYDSSCFDPDHQYVLDIMFDEGSAPIADLLAVNNRLYNINFTLTYNVHACDADHKSFQRVGYPAIMTHSQLHGAQVHTPNDTIEFMSPDFALKNAQLGSSVLFRLLDMHQ